MRLKREVTGVVEADDSAWDVALGRLRTWWQEERIAPVPHCEEPRARARAPAAGSRKTDSGAAFSSQATQGQPS